MPVFFMGNIINFIVLPDQSIIAVKPNPAVQPSLLCEVLLWKDVQHISWDDIISRLRTRTYSTKWLCISYMDFRDRKHN